MRPETWPASSWNRGMTGWIPSAKGRCRSATGYLRRSARGTAVRSGAGSHRLCRPHDMARNIDEQTSTRVARLVILRSRPRWRTAQLRPTRSPNMGAEQHIWAAPTAFPFRSRRSTLEASSCWDNMPAKTKQTAPSRNRGCDLRLLAHRVQTRREAPPPRWRRCRAQCARPRQDRNQRAPRGCCACGRIHATTGQAGRRNLA